MIIDFDKIEAQFIDHFKGGEGTLETYNYCDEDNKIMYSRLKPQSNSGLHRHEGNSEIMFILSGEGHFVYDDTEEPATAGTVHYCKRGHSHALYNDGDTDLVYMSVVPEHCRS
ncbi:MAG: cupin domain-containing protein [Prevotella sp.]|nr:cupin domain-containing protein [Prevotella sp.]